MTQSLALNDGGKTNNQLGKAFVVEQSEEEKAKLKKEEFGGSEELADDSDVTQRNDNWDHPIQFILSCVGYAVGLGNIWRFPYLCLENGGGAFLIPYFLSLAFCGIPMFFLETCIGQFSGMSLLDIWKVCPLFRGIGYGMAIASGMCCIYYNTIMAWVLFYLFKSMTPVLPWSECGNPWNTPQCRSTATVAKDNGGFTLNNHTGSGLSYNFTDDENGVAVNSSGLGDNTINKSTLWNTAAEEYWQHEVLQITPGIDVVGGMRWELFGLFVLSWFLVYLCLFRGVRSLGKVVYVTATSPYLFLTLVLIRGATLPGAIDGVKFYILPNWTKLLDFRVWVLALIQMFNSLGPGFGSIVVMASHNKFNNNCMRDSFIVPLTNGLSSFYGGFVVFSVLGFMAHSTGTTVDQFVKSGPGLIFVVYPEALAKLPLSPMWSILFFFMIFTIGLDSLFGTFECMNNTAYNALPKRLRRHKWAWTAVFCGVELLLGSIGVTRGGVYYFQIMDWYATKFTVIILATLECLVITYIYGHRQFCGDIELMLGSKVNIFWKVCWRFVTPAILLVILGYSITVMREPTYGSYQYPGWAIAWGWALAMVSLIPLPVCAVRAVLQQQGSLLQRIVKASRPDPSWGPSNRSQRNLYQYTKKPSSRWTHCIRHKRSIDLS